MSRSSPNCVCVPPGAGAEASGRPPSPDPQAACEGWPGRCGAGLGDRAGALGATGVAGAPAPE
eukprot:2815807-Alexandrium_andersonii.AAC.1